MKKAKARKFLEKNDFTFDILLQMAHHFEGFANDMSDRGKRLRKLVRRAKKGLATGFVAKEVANIIKANRDSEKRLLRWFALLPVALKMSQEAKATKAATSPEPSSPNHG